MIKTLCCSFDHTARPPMTLFMHVLSDLLPKNFLALKQYCVFNLFLKSMGTQENQNAEKLERERTVGLEFYI